MQATILKHTNPLMSIPIRAKLRNPRAKQKGVGKRYNLFAFASREGEATTHPHHHSEFRTPFTIALARDHLQRCGMATAAATSTIHLRAPTRKLEKNMKEETHAEGTGEPSGQS